MPNIIVREYDSTKTSPSPYENFSVLVPGYVADGKGVDKAGNDIFEATGAVELTSQAEFRDLIGFVDINDAPAKPVSYASLDEGDYNWDADGGELLNLFTFGEGAEYATEGEATNAFYNAKNATGKKHVYIAEKLAGDPEEGKGEGYWQFDDQADWYELTLCDGDDLFDTSKIYVICSEDKIGNDVTEPSNAKQIGNQIAYELLGLGYTVLYKKIEAVSDLYSESFWADLKDKSIYNFRYVITGLRDKNFSANEQICKLATFKNSLDFDKESFTTDTGRGDIIALVDIDEDNYANKYKQKDLIKAFQTAANDMTFTDKYSAIFAPAVQYEDASLSGRTNYKNRVFPASFHYLICAKKAFETFSEWYAVSGFTRGVCDFAIKGLISDKKLGEIASEALQPRTTDKKFDNVATDHAVNLVVNIRGNYYLWGNRTAEKLTSSLTQNGGDLRASHFLNIRQLCTTLKKQIYDTCHRYQFDPNSDVLWFNLLSEIKPILERMKADQGIRDYRITKIRSNQKAKLKAKIRIVPIEAVEDFDINLFLEGSIAGLVLADDEIE